MCVPAQPPMSWAHVLDQSAMFPVQERGGGRRWVSVTGEAAMGKTMSSASGSRALLRVLYTFVLSAAP